MERSVKDLNEFRSLDDFKDRELSEEYLSKICAGYMSKEDQCLVGAYLGNVQCFYQNHYGIDSIMNEMIVAAQQMGQDKNQHTFIEFRSVARGILESHNLRDINTNFA